MLDAADDVEMEIVDQPAEDPVRLDETNLEAESEQIEIPEPPSREARRRPAELTAESAQSSNAMATTPPRNHRGTASTTTLALDRMNGPELREELKLWGVSAECLTVDMMRAKIKHLRATA